MNRERLQHLITVLENAALRQINAPTEFLFNMNYFVVNGDSLSGDTEVVPEFCGMAACAFGSAALDPTFQGMGLIPKVECNDVEFDGFLGFEAGAEFFDINSAEAEFLFDPSEYSDRYMREGVPEDFYLDFEVDQNIKPKHVIRRVKFLLEDNEIGSLIN